MVICYQQVINVNQWLLIINKLSMVLKGYLWLSVSYQWLSLVIKGY